MTAPLDLENENELRRECRVFCRYLIGREPSAFVVDKYVAGHASLPVTASPDALERALLACASAASWLTSLADCYAAVARREGLLRKKLVLLVAILENAAGTHRWFDTAEASGRLTTAALLVLSGMAWAGRLAVSMVIFGAVHLVAATAQRGARG